MSFRGSKPTLFKGLRRAGDGGAVSFELACACGASIRGLRLDQSQIATCSVCGAKRFVLPRGPLPDVILGLEPGEAHDSKRARSLLWLAIPAGVVVIAGIAIIVWSLNRASWRSSSQQPLSDAERLEKHLNEGQAAIAEGSWHQATRELSAAIELLDRVSTSDRKGLVQRQRQAAIMADLLAEAPVEIARQSLGMPEREWAEVFHERYAGRSLILDDALHRDASGQYHQQLRIMLHNVEMRYDLTSVKLLQQLPLNQPRRVLIGFRLAGIRKNAAGWTILLDPDSGVLMTDEAMLASLSVPVDAGLREVLKRQQSWLEALP